MNRKAMNRNIQKVGHGSGLGGRMDSLSICDIEKNIEIDEYHMHEILHTTWILANMVDEYLEKHIAIRKNVDWAKRVETISDDLEDLYQQIGAVHLGNKDNKNDATGKTD